MIRAYLSHPIRGAKGKDATREDMEANNQRAIQFAVEIRRACPGLDLYVPAEHDEFVLRAYELGLLNEHEILAVDVTLVHVRDLLIVYTPDDYISRGMQQEIEAAQEHSIPIVWTEGCTTPILHALENFKR